MKFLIPVSILTLLILLTGFAINQSGNGHIQGAHAISNARDLTDRHKSSPYVHETNTPQCSDHALDGRFIFTHGELKHYLCALEVKRPQVATAIQKYFSEKEKAD